MLDRLEAIISSTSEIGFWIKFALNPEAYPRGGPEGPRTSPWAFRGPRSQGPANILRTQRAPLR